MRDQCADLCVLFIRNLAELAVLQGRAVTEPLEKTVEIGLFQSDNVADLLNRNIGFPQQPHCVAEPVLIH